MNKARGFTLLEIMVAVAFFAIVAGALVKSATQMVKQTAIIEERTFAFWIAENALEEIRAIPRDGSDFPNTGSDRTPTTMAGREWEVVVDYEATENENVRRVTVSVFDENDLDRSLVSLTSFIGKY